MVFSLDSHFGRIIPAYAGSTWTAATWTAASMDHPRIRGEHAPAYPSGVPDEGSSPHTRGARGPDHDRDRAVGIIPAYAGSTIVYAVLYRLR